MSAPLAPGETVALTGATGIVGEFALDQLRAGGFAVRALGRHRQPPRHGMGWIVGDLEQAEFADLLGGAAGLVHAGLAHLPGRYRGGEGDHAEAFWRTNFLATQRLLAEARRAGVRRVVLLSSRAVYRAGDWPAGPIDETAPTDPDTHYGLHKAAIEGLTAIETAAAMAVACLRPTGVYGHRRELSTSPWVPLVRAIRSVRAPGELRTTTQVHGRDLARAIGLMLTAPTGAITGQVFNVSDLVVDGVGLATAIAAIAGVAPPELPAPRALSGPILATGKLRALGFAFGGAPLLAADLEALVARCAAAPS